MLPESEQWVSRQNDPIACMCHISFIYDIDLIFIRYLMHHVARANPAKTATIPKTFCPAT